MYADGNIRKHGNQSVIQIKVNDYEIIDKFIKSINGNMSVKTYKRKDGSDYYALNLTSDQMFNDLNNLGCIPRKSLVLAFPHESVFKDKNLIRHFIRGYFDGDGGISCYNRTNFSKRTNSYKVYTRANVQFIGTFEFLSKLNEFINFKNPYREKRRQSNTWYIQLANKSGIQMFYDYLYKNATIFLTRKNQKFKQFLNL